ncbi:MAG: hypothetical protein JXA77_11520 [Bacteroidales bacterium]|nr:hypothetical protein [Bacteroidales bacterium]MBN2820635.1 hypothetical protein [Bacteroidales bacterium]
MTTRYNLTQRMIQIFAFIVGLLLMHNVMAAEPERPKNNLPAYTEVAIENDIELESWMLDLSSWTLNENETFEADIQIEDWMLDASAENWTIVSQEEEIEIEDWMTDLSQWNTK